MPIAGCDYSSHAIDVVFLDEETDAATWHRFPLTGQDSFDRARAVREAMPSRGWWDDQGVLALGIEQPRGNHGVVHVARIQGAILSCVPRSLLVQPHNPAEWRKTVGLPGNASKDDVARWVKFGFGEASEREAVREWPQDACDAYCIALATRSLLQHGERVA